jgi:GNAT superfamily N-acetyltransferase
MIDNAQLRFQILDFPGLKTLTEWAEQEGWNVGLHDADVFWQTDPDGYYGCFHNGELIAGGSIVSYSGAFGFMGLFIVRPDYRGQGIGKHLWYKRRDALLSRLQAGAAIGMDGVVAMQPFYQKGGFELAFRDVRFEKTGQSCNVDPHISRMAPSDFDSILTYDTPCFGFARPQFLKPWLAQPGIKAFKYVKGGSIRAI